MENINSIFGKTPDGGIFFEDKVGDEDVIAIRLGNAVFCNDDDELFCDDDVVIRAKQVTVSR